MIKLLSHGDVPNETILGNYEREEKKKLLHYSNISPDSKTYMKDFESEQRVYSQVFTSKTQEDNDEIVIMVQYICWTSPYRAIIGAHIDLTDASAFPTSFLFASKEFCPKTVYDTGVGALLAQVVDDNTCVKRSEGV